MSDISARGGGFGALISLDRGDVDEGGILFRLLGLQHLGLTPLLLFARLEHALDEGNVRQEQDGQQQQDVPDQRQQHAFAARYCRVDAGRLRSAFV